MGVDVYFWGLLATGVCLGILGLGGTGFVMKVRQGVKALVEREGLRSVAGDYEVVVSKVGRVLGAVIDMGGWVLTASMMLY